MSDWLEDKFCARCEESVSVKFGYDFVNGRDLCYDCLPERVDELEAEVVELKRQLTTKNGSVEG